MRHLQCQVVSIAVHELVCKVQFTFGCPTLSSELFGMKAGDSSIGQLREVSRSEGILPSRIWAPNSGLEIGAAPLPYKIPPLPPVQKKTAPLKKKRSTIALRRIKTQCSFRGFPFKSHGCQDPPKRGPPKKKDPQKPHKNRTFSPLLGVDGESAPFWGAREGSPPKNRNPTNCKIQDFLLGISSADRPILALDHRKPCL